MLTSGLRASEVVSIDVADLQMVEGHHVVWVTGKGGARERVKVQPHAWQAIAVYRRAAQLDHGPLFRRVHAVGPRTHLPPGMAQDQRIGDGRLSYTGLYALLQERFLTAGFVAGDPGNAPREAPAPSGRRKYGAKV